MVHEAHGFVGGNGDVDIPPEVVGELLGAYLFTIAVGEPYRPDGCVLGSASRACYSCRGDGEIDIQQVHCSLHHLSGYFLTDGSFLLQQLVVHLEQSFFDLVGVAHHASLEVVGGAGVAMMASLIKPPVQLSAVPSERPEAYNMSPIWREIILVSNSMVLGAKCFT